MSVFRRPRLQDHATNEAFVRLEQYFLFFHEETVWQQGVTGNEAIANSAAAWVKYNPGTGGADLEVAGFQKNGSTTETFMLFTWGFTFYVSAGQAFNTFIRSTHADTSVIDSAAPLFTMNAANDHRYWGWGVKVSTMKPGLWTCAVMWGANTTNGNTRTTGTDDYGWLNVREVPMDKINGPEF